MRYSLIVTEQYPCNVRDCMIDFVLTHVETGTHSDTGAQIPRL